MRARTLVLTALLLTVGLVAAAPTASAEECTNDSEDLSLCYDDLRCDGPVCAYRTYCVIVAGVRNCTYS